MSVGNCNDCLDLYRELLKCRREAKEDFYMAVWTFVILGFVLGFIACVVVLGLIGDQP